MLKFDPAEWTWRIAIPPVVDKKYCNRCGDNYSIQDRTVCFPCGHKRCMVLGENNIPDIALCYKLWDKNIEMYAFYY